MSVDTRCYLPGVKLHQLEKFLSIFSSVTIEESTLYPKEMFYLKFSIFGEERKITIHLIKVNNSKNDSNSDDYGYVHDHGFPDKTSGLYMSLGCYGYAIYVMKLLCYMFGGYLKEEDVKRGKFIKINKDYKEVIRGIFHE